jgi:hypothetical protein
MKKRYRDIEGFEEIRDIALEQLISGLSPGQQILEF